MLHYLILRRDIPQFPPNNLVAAGVHLPAAYRADTFFLWQLVNNLLCWQLRKVQFPFPSLLFPLVYDLL
ncbi:hypothetical protein ADH66_07755 [Acutalibacter muris]|uniref:Uncharacterized protein n=1 Tax=Acutalibacter muris TaxID=1796620 RepID=A0ABN5A591_9FIRM|nr:hypothetical protein ADH66_07755 [Acutalibacter muris]